MSASPATSRLGLWLGGTVVGLDAVAIVASLFSHAPGLWVGVTALGIASAAYGAVGGLIASRASRNPVGWLLVTAALVVALTAVEVALVLFFGNDASEAPRAIQLVFGWTLVLVPLSVAPLCLVTAFLYFPDGELVSRRFRPFVWAAIASASFFFLGFLGHPEKLGLSELRLSGPAWARSLPGSVGYPGVAGAVLVVAGLGVVASLLIRSRRAAADERAAIRWVLRLLLALAVVIPLPLLFQWFGFIIALLVGIGVVFFGLPTALAVGVLKYRLYEVDLVIRKTLVGAALVGFVVLSFFLLVLLPSTIIGGGGIEPIALIPAVVIALGLGPVRRWARRGADRLLYGERATPYEVLSEFADRVGETYSIEDVLPRMAQLLAAGTGASVARVWLHLGDELREVAHVPADATPGTAVALHGGALPPSLGDGAIFPVTQHGEMLGALTLAMPASDPMNASKERLAKDVAGQAGLVLRNVRLIEELRASRQRLVAAQDEERRKIERDIHDGAQQQLVALAVQLKLAEQLVERDPAAARAALVRLQSSATVALEDLRDLARGIYPPLLADKGLSAALESQAHRAAVPTTVESIGITRYPPGVESAVYFCALEAMNNVAKYAAASTTCIRLTVDAGTLAFEVVDDGSGFDQTNTSHGTGLLGMADRLEALGGRLRVESSRGRGTTVTGTVPVGSTS